MLPVKFSREAENDKSRSVKWVGEMHLRKFHTNLSSQEGKPSSRRKTLQRVVFFLFHVICYRTDEKTRQRPKLDSNTNIF